MKTATVRDLRNHYSGLLDWIAAGEEILITRRGRVVARLVPESADSGEKADWKQSPAMLRNRSALSLSSQQDVSELLKQSAGKW
ncbi:MAG: type II toxin-antitoxin system prevent-host-death family antitoxin [Verrucomicrobia bacterium]|nr:type II toxin-antitoxin system prevent-host-death family antitoxin [Verrucomicrobiota bacterium]MCH8527611.1 type II toxin-antitoxin system prevent-host-death family antitoxin [Kiritimatiellia bacterium]